jgi:AcrR family transcriptional regulator
MGRWLPGAADRLAAAAMGLYAEQGFERTTVAEIAERAGVTERTFFRYFADKREVVFSGQERFLAAFTDALRDVPVDLPPMEAVAAAVVAVGAFFDDREHSLQRDAIIAENPALREREAYKMILVAAALRAELVARGTTPLAAAVAAEAGVAAFRLAFERWLVDGETRDMAELSRSTLAELRTVAAG